MREIQRIKSEGDYAAATAVVECYGVKVDQIPLKEVCGRFAKLNTAPYKGFMQPQLKATFTGETVNDVTVTYPDNFLQNQLELGKKYGFLPVYN